MNLLFTEAVVFLSLLRLISSGGYVSERESGLRSLHTVNRVDTAHNIAKEVVKKKFPELWVLDRVLSKKSGPNDYIEPDMLAKYGNACINQGGFEIRDKGPNPIALIHVPSFRKPVIYVRPGYESLGTAIQKAYKEHAKYWFNPKVKVSSKLLPTELFYDSDARNRANKQ